MQLSLGFLASQPALPPAAEVVRPRIWLRGAGRTTALPVDASSSRTPPPDVLGGEWLWNPLATSWLLHYERPPFPLDPVGVTIDTAGATRLVPPAQFRLISPREFAGKCAHCHQAAGRSWPGQGWQGWSDPRIAQAVANFEASGRHCYALTPLDVAGFDGWIMPMSHYTRWSALYCNGCGAVFWHDFLQPPAPPGFYCAPPALSLLRSPRS